MLRTSSARFGFRLFALVFSTALAVALLVSGLNIENWKLKINRSADAQTAAGTNLVTLTGGGFGVSSVTVNNASSVILIANATQTVTISFTVSGGDGCGNAFFGGGTVTTTLYRSGVSSTCGIDDPQIPNWNYLNCYVATTSTNNCASVTSTAAANATATFYVYYFAEATDASSSYAAQNWLGFVSVLNASGTGASSTAASGQELLTLLGLNVETSSIDYGSLSPNSDTTSTNQVATVKNAGNSSTTLRLNGTAMTSGGNTIATSSQHYSTSTFTYNTNDNQLQESATDVGGFTIPRPPLARWGTTTPLLFDVREHDGVAYNGYLYSIGGDVSGSVATSTVLFAPIGATGTIGSWAVTAALPSATMRHAVVANNGYMYVIGGSYDAQTSTEIVYVAPIGSTGSLGAWATTTPLPGSLNYHAAVVNSNTVYVLGGRDFDFTRTTTVLRASPGSTGTIGSWATTTALPTSLTELPAVVNNGYLYVVGGLEVGATNTVLYAPIGSTGTLGNWAVTTPLPSATRQNAAVANGGYLFSFGGRSGSTRTSTVLYALIGSTGTISNWGTTSFLSSQGVATQPVVVNNGIAYSIGGDTAAGSRTSTVQYSSLATRNTYWGVAAQAGLTAGNYTGVNTFTAVFQP